MYLGKIYKNKECVIKVSEMEGAPETDATITIRLLTPGERKALLMSSFKTTYAADDTGSMKPEMLSEHYKMNENIFIKATFGWSGFFDDDAGIVPLKFGHAGKMRLLSVLPELADLVAERHEIMVRDEFAERDTAKKNSLSESQGSATQTSRTAKNAES